MPGISLEERSDITTAMVATLLPVGTALYGVAKGTGDGGVAEIIEAMASATPAMIAPILGAAAAKNAPGIPSTTAAAAVYVLSDMVGAALEANGFPAVGLGVKAGGIGFLAGVLAGNIPHIVRNATAQGRVQAAEQRQL